MRTWPARQPDARMSLLDGWNATHHGVRGWPFNVCVHLPVCTLVMRIVWSPCVDAIHRLHSKQSTQYASTVRQWHVSFMQIFHHYVFWTAKKTNEWVLNKAGVNRELLDTVKARKLAYYGHTMRKQRSCLEKEIMQGTMPGARRRGRPCTAWMDNIKTWTGLSVEESVRMTEDRDK